MMLTKWPRKDLLTMSDVSKEEILEILDYAETLKDVHRDDLLKGVMLAFCFFEPSTRTRISFETAVKRYGGEVVGFSDEKMSAIKKGESFSDTVNVIGQFADIMVVRHPLEGAAARAAEMTDIPVINAGDGSNQHPTQTLLDLFSIRQCQGRLEDLKIAFLGDLCHGRAVHSLLQALTHFGARLYFISPKGLELPKQICSELKRKSLLFSFHEDIEEVLPKVDIAYISRIQSERLPSHIKDQVKTDDFLIKKPMLKNVKENFRILHPLPRVLDIDPVIDRMPYAYYFRQVRNGIPIRQALMSLLLGKRS